jgi:pimeloyl-ACP methyl ester carboxylesterase
VKIPIQRADRTSPGVMAIGAGLVALVAGVAIASRASAGPTVPVAPARIALAPCHLDGLSEEVLCGRHEVFEDRERRVGRKIALRLAVLPALQREASPDPLVLLAGGPGQGAIDLAGAASRFFRPIRQRREIVLVDLRGTGESHPLACGPGAGDLEWLAGAIPEEALRRCVETVEADLRLYGTAAAMDDLDEIREALGYERINLWGGSYGTRAALVYARRHPDRVRSVVLDGAAPFGLRLPLHNARGAQRALDRLIDDCAADEACGAAYPRLREAIERLLARLDRAPATAALRHPRTGEPWTISVTRDFFASALRGFLYVPAHAALLPFVVSAAGRDDFAPFATLVLETATWSVETMSLGLTLSILCSEEVPRIDPAEVDAAVRGTYVRRSEYDAWSAMCRVWPRGVTPDDTDAPLPRAVPALILSGDIDPVTPPEWGEAMAIDFPGSRHVVVPGTGHNTTFTGCVPDLIARFVERGGAADLDASCVSSLRRPPFVLGAAGTAP